MKSFKKQPSWFQRGLCTPLDALSYTNNVLVVMAFLTVFGGIFLIAFAGDITSMSHQISSINDMERKYLNEKIDVISVDLTVDYTVITLTNYGKYPVEILGILDGTGTELICETNNSDVKNFVILPEELLEFTCDILKPFDSTAIHYVVTDTRQIIEVMP
mgnify:CR=1 FL=1|jgi:hypothetical protein